MRESTPWEESCLRPFDTASLFTARGRNRKGLPERLADAQELIEALPVPVFVKGRDGRYLAVNKAWEEFFGIPRDAMVGKTVFDREENPSIAARHQARDEELWNHPGRRSYETRITLRDGGAGHIISYKGTFTGSDGEVAGLVCTIIDITTRKQAERAWQESEARFRSLTELSSDWYWAQDENFRFTEISRGITDSIGILPADYIGKTLWDDESIGLSEAEWAAHKATLTARQPFQDFEYAYKGAHGRVLYVSVSGRPVLDEAGKFKGYRGIGKDITARKLAETNLREAHDELSRKAQELARSNEELQQFAYVASHDLQEPLRMVSSYTQLLARRYATLFDGDAREFMAFIVDGATRMKQLIEDLLAYSRVGMRGREFQLTDCGASLQSALVNLRAAIDASGTTITHDPLPSVTADGSQLAQLFQNIIGNAIKFRSAEAPCIHVRAQEQDDAWVISIKDNGVGIDPPYFERIFIMFQRLHGKGEYPGTGIGLAICKKIVDRHGGRIWVESEPGRGCTFCFALPKRQEADSGNHLKQP